MIGINSNINSLVAQQNLNGTQSALSSAITRLSSGKRINSAADDAAGLAIASRMTSQINGLNQGVSNANDGVSMVQTASAGLNQIADNLQRIRQLAVQASSGSLSASDQSALQSEVSQRIAEVNRISSQTTYNGKNVLDGSQGTVTFQVGANVGQSISINLSQNMSAATLNSGTNGANPQAGTTLGTLTNLSLDDTGGDDTANTTTAHAITQINVVADGKGGYSYTDQNNQTLTTVADGGNFDPSKVFATASGKITGTVGNGTNAGIPAADDSQGTTIANNSTVQSVSSIDLTKTDGASMAIEAIDNALQTVNSAQATLGAVQNRFSSVASTQQEQSTNLSQAQSQITDANFAQETANLSKAQVLQQAGISVLAQANSMPQQVLKLLG
ncbi:flagellin protein [Caballeronia calidae]|uniref:Flagellin n=1 Tax=Caballeronia calidae TaxID=1777139 RepID=A0A158DTI9_9BURK|nr:flagellin [Caballeronia calidae]SAK97884.1 flagellin protein [Caballeronia calidae]